MRRFTTFGIAQPDDIPFAWIGSLVGWRDCFSQNEDNLSRVRSGRRQFLCFKLNDDLGKEKLRHLLWKQSAFSGVKISTYCLTNPAFKKSTSSRESESRKNRKDAKREKLGLRVPFALWVNSEVFAKPWRFSFLSFLSALPQFFRFSDPEDRGTDQNGLNPIVTN